VPLTDNGPGSAIFWNATDILNFARVLVNDCQGGLSGQDLADDRPYTWPLLNLCYAKLANWLEDANVESATYAEAIITLPTNSGFMDPNAQARLGYDGFSIGVGIDPTAGFHYPTPALPPDMLEPLSLWERPTGQNSPFIDMKQHLGGLGARYGGRMYRQWEFRQNSIYLLGGSFTGLDLRVRYIPGLPALVRPTEGQPAPVIWFAHAGEALAYLVAAEFAEIRNAANAPNLRMKANEQLQILANKSAKRSNQAQTRRIGYGFRRARRRIWL
jgi:hypothetical protein